MSRKTGFYFFAATLGILLLLTTLGAGWAWHDAARPASPGLSPSVANPPDPVSWPRLKAGRDRLVRAWLPLTIVFGAGSLAGLLLLARHLTATADIHRREAGNQRHRARLLRATLDAAADGIQVVDVQGRILFSNLRFAAMWGLSPERLVRSDGDDVLRRHVEAQVPSPEAYQTRIAEINAGDETAQDTVVFKDGRVFERYASPFRLDGRVAGRFWNFRDISAQKQAEAALIQSESKFASFFNAAPIWMVLATRDEGRYLEVNRAFMETTGYTREEVVGRTSTEIGIWQRAADRHEAIALLEKRGRLDAYPVTFRMKDGTRRELLWSVETVRYEGQTCLLSGVLDVTNLKRAERLLRESERNYSEIFNATTEAIFIHDAASGKIRDVNRAMLKMYGCSYAEALETSVDELSLGQAPYSQQEVLEKLVRAVAEGPQLFEWRSRRRNGELFWSEVALRSARIGGVPSVLAVVRDIDQRKNAQDAREQLARDLAQTKTLLETVLDAIPDVIGVQDTAHRVLRYNRAGYEMLACSPEEIDGRRCHDLIGRVMPCDVCATSEVLQTRQPAKVERYVDELGKWFDIRSYPVMDQDGQLVQVIEHLRDITREKEDRQVLKEREELLRLFVAFTPAAVAMCDRDMRYLVYSQRWVKDYHLAPRNLTGACHYDVFPEIPPHWKDQHRRVLAGELIENQEEAFVRHDGSIDWVRRTLMPWRDTEGQIGGLIMLTDVITERKQNEIELARHRDHLEKLVAERTRALHAAQDELVQQERLAALGKLTATVSHELRNPLGTINSSLYIIEQRLRGQVPGTERAIVRARRNIARCDNIIDELLDFTRRRELQTEAVPIDVWLKDLIEGLPVSEGIRIDCDLHAGVSMAVDPERLRRAVINCLTNAVQAVEQKDAIAADDGVGVETRCAAGQLEIVIRDSGGGIAETELDKIFEPLFSTKGFGVGLGLPATRQVMEQHGGGIRIASTPGQGTTVALWLPLPDESRP
jgi:PAS domain S-box-containing protein